jgi:alkylated DNA repair protein alkB family protein 1
MILRSGDVFIMSGRGRQAYHGVPRIMEGCLPKHFHPLAYDGQMQGEDGDAGEEGDATDRAVREWMATARVNINVRQVFPPGFERPHD